MLGNLRLGLPPGDVRAYAVRVLRALDARRIAAAAVTTVLLSLGILVSPTLVDFFSPAEIAVAWLEHLAELSVLAAGLLLVYTFLDEALPSSLPMRLALVCTVLFVAALAFALLLFAYYAHGFAYLPSPLRLLSEALHWGLPAIFLAAIGDVHQRSLRAESAAHAADLARVQQVQGEAEQQLALLQAQIEPHFLFNMLANVRRLYRTRPQAGAEAIESLMRYLRTAMPQVRNASGTLADEIELVRAYLELYRIRMGSRLGYRIDVDPALDALAFPPMLAMTLVENAIRHGLEPAGGGQVLVRARRNRDSLEVEVTDDGLGFGGAASSGTGVGLANVRRQLAARYAGQGSLALDSVDPHGARARITIPLVAAAVSRLAAGQPQSA
ncbi:histidine kinase [Ramlibacter sp.]|uniref:sensor histidine kinase n=1 Tax=Ramlibacter sp. TaxID=1917967 RepID=UPI00262B1F7B|nr:histidine kinase [Ramlibacter sp.]MDB5954803.1 sensor histidine kinase [Ramlibacter sp.]